ncbi:MAG: type II toxin-antitoxin system PemK/MazF family toxin [Elusimicrobia bacterium]|nr:type II toxin-antitoxin system PemK/MazF family toxin [Elusimicrobiota bacterium]
MTPIRRGWIYLADLNPARGTEPGKVRPVLVVQTDLLNGVHPSTVVCPLTTKVERQARRLRVHLAKGEGGLASDSDVLIDQVRAIDNRRLMQPVGAVPRGSMDAVSGNLALILGLGLGT